MGTSIELLKTLVHHGNWRNLVNAPVSNTGVERLESSSLSFPTMEMHINLRISGFKHLPEVSCYNSNYFELDAKSYDSWIGGAPILFEECHEDENYCTYSLGRFVDGEYKPVIEWEGEYGECFKDIFKE